MRIAVRGKNKGLLKTAGALLTVGILSATLVAKPEAVSSNDNQIQAKLTQKLTAKNQFRDVRSSVENGTITVTGTVDLFQNKLDAAKLARKAGWL